VAAAIINLVVSFFIVLPSFGFATAFPIRTFIKQLACHGTGARKALKTRSSDTDFHHLRTGRFTAVNREVHQHLGWNSPKPITHLTLLLNFFDELRRRVVGSGN
jgi:hypothetical protein